MRKKLSKEKLLDLYTVALSNNALMSKPGMRELFCLLFELTKTEFNLTDRSIDWEKAKNLVEIIRSLVVTEQFGAEKIIDFADANKGRNERKRLLFKFLEIHIDDPDAKPLIEAVNDLRNNFKLNESETARVDAYAQVLGL